nr:glycosyltransferase [Acidipila sp. EB88]
MELFLDGAFTPKDGQIAPKTKGDGLTLLWAGRIVTQKGLPIALRAVAACSKKEVRMVVAGTGETEDAMKGLARSLGLEDRVTFLGRVSPEAMAALFDRCDALIFTSLREAFGTVILEAAGRGLPVIGLNHQGLRAFVPDAASVKVEPGSLPQMVRGFADACDCLAADPQRLRSMSEAALQFASEQTAERRAVSMLHFYEELLSGPAGRVLT